MSQQFQSFIPPDHLSDTLELFIFLKTFQDQLGLKNIVAPKQIYDMMVEKSHIVKLQTVIGQMMVSIYDQLLISCDVILTSHYHKLLFSINEQSLLELIIYNTWDIFIENFSSIPRIKLLFKKLEDLNIRDKFDEIREKTKNQQDFMNESFEVKMNFFRFLINYIFRECAFIQNFCQEQIILLKNGIKQEEHFKEAQSQWQEEIKSFQDEIKELQKEIGIYQKKNSLKNKTMTKDLYKEISKRENKINNLKKYESYQYFDIILFGIGQVYTIQGKDTGSYYYVIKNVFDSIFEKKVINGKVQMRQMINKDQKIIIDKLTKNGDSDLIYRLQLLKQIGYFQNYESKSQVDGIQTTNSISDSQELEILGINKSFLITFGNTEVYPKLIIQILAETEKSFHDFEVEFWQTTWCYPEDRELWHQELQAACDPNEFQAFIEKLPNQLSNVNNKFLRNIDEWEDNFKPRHSRILWFDWNYKFKQPFQILIKNQNQRFNLQYCLTLMIHVNLKKHLHKQLQKIENERRPIMTQKQSYTQKNSSIQHEEVKVNLRRRQKVIYDEDDDDFDRDLKQFSFSRPGNK